jgi:uncharacterized protein YcbK (DUF882 family)
MEDGAGLSRRWFLRGMAGAAALSATAMPAAAARRLLTPRALAFNNLHTGERLHTVYWADGRYLPEAMRHINWLLRDFRTDQVHPMDPALLDLLADLQARLHTREPFQVISGYRSPETNAMLASLGDGVAQNSQHLLGKAIDIRVPGRRLDHVRAAALSLRRGGVGYYPRSDFVHVDTGRVRYW